MMKIGKLEKIDLRHVWSNEPTKFTTWIESNKQHLCDFLGFNLEILEREKKVGSFSIDLYAELDNGEKVIIENQLEKTDHGHLGQIITYFTNLDEKVKTVIWIAKDVRPEHENAVNWFNKYTDLRFYLIQVEAYKIGNSDPAPYFKIVCEPNDNVKAIGHEIKDFSEREKFNVLFWESLMEKCKNRLNHFTNKKAPKYHYLQGSAGKGGLSFVFLATAKFYGVELYIDFGNEEENYSYLMALKEYQDEIESEFKHKLIWDEISEKRACRIRYIIKEVSVVEIEKDAVQEDLIQTMEKFEKVFRPRIKNLSIVESKAS